ncbi:MAG: carboxypeptidase regulatory-like domain-containing protein [Saprospiraceae bacterium]|nr:carboxypeptidase regulatory-like domain-containing protein [Saprospiraceae bacterium]
MKKLVHILLLCAHLACYGQEKTEVRVSNLPESVNPGQFFSMFLHITSDQPLQQGFQNRVTLPNNWKVITEKKLTTTNDSSSIKFLYSISVPPQYPAGTYPIDFQIFVNDEKISSKTVKVQISEVRQLEVTALNQPEYVKEGEVLKVTYLIQNLGNKTERIHLSTSHGEVENGKDSIDISPNSYRQVVVKQSIPVTEHNTWQTSSDLKVVLKNQLAPIIQTVSVPVYAAKVKRNDPYLRFPLDIGVSRLDYRLGQQTSSAYQVNAEGKGYLDFAKKHHLDLLLRGPSQFTFPTIGNYDHYSVAYSYEEKTNVVVGDYGLKINNLMEFGRYGRGFKVDQNLNKAQATIFYQQARFFPNQKDAFGGSYVYKLKGDSKIGVQFISKNLTADNTLFRSNIVGVSSFLKKRYFINETELALGQAKSKYDIGFYNKFHSHYNRLTFNSELIHAGKNFYGFYTNSLLFVNSLNYYLTPKFNIGVNSNITRINPSLDVLRYAISPYTSTHTAFLSYQPNSKNLFHLNFTKQEREDRQQPSTFHFKEDFGNFFYNLTTSKVTVFAQARYGFAQNLMAIDSLRRKQFTSYMAQPSVAVLPWLWIGGYFEHQHTTKFSATNTYQDLFFYGGNVRLNYKNRVSLNFMYRNNYAPDEFFEQRSFMDGSLIVNFDKHQLSLIGGRVYLPNLSNNDQNTVYLTTKYVYRLNLGIKKDKKLGHINGQISATSSNINREGILMQLGQYKVLTDKEGRFSFPNLVPDRYFVTMVQDEKRLGIVPTQKLPLEINVKAENTELVNITLIKSGGVVGSVKFENSNNSTPSVKPTIYIKLYNEKESFTTQMNEKGEFSFKEMKPGSWHLKAFMAGKNEQFEIVNTEQDIEIEAGQLKNSVFNVKTIERKIQFSGQSFHISSDKKKP